MTRKANNQSEFPLQSSRWKLLIRHPLLLKVVTWLSSLSMMASASVSWAEIKPIEITAQSATPNFVQSAPLQVTAPTTAVPVAFSGADLAAAQHHKKLHTDLLGADNFIAALPTPGRTPQRSYQSKSGVPLAMQVPTAIDCNNTARQLISSLCSKVRPQSQARVVPIPTVQVQPRVAPIATMRTQSRVASVPTVRTPATPVVAPLPVVNRQPARILSRLSGPNRLLPQPQLRLAKPKLLSAQAAVPNAVPLFVPAPQTNVVPVISRMPTVSRPQVPAVAPLPTVQTAKVGSAMPTAMAMVNYEINADFIYPLATPAPITSNFGWRVHPITGNRRFHAGMDFGAPTGTPIVAVASGRVVVANWHGGYGKAVIIEHSNGKLQTLYGHMSEIFVQEGQEIPQGTVIGHVGSTGNSTGPHLHFETKVPTADGWVVVNPAPEVRYALDNLQEAMRYSRRPN